ncbi:glycosyltransferase [Clostridium perfringens]
MLNKVSVIIPVYNVESYVDDCLNSLINQSFKCFEVIAINDGSTDNSLKCLEYYRKNSDLNIKIINQKNSGLSASRNRGIKESNGEYILFLDSDDMLDKYAIEKLYGEAKKNNSDLVIFDPLRFNDDTKIFEEGEAERKNIYTNKYMDINEYLRKTKEKCLLMSTLHFYKSDIIKNNNIFFKEGILHEDELHSLTMYMYIKKVSYIDEKLYIRRFREGSIMTNDLYNNDKSLESYIYVLKSLNKIKNKNSNLELNSLIDYRGSLILSNLIRYKNMDLKKLLEIKKDLSFKLLKKRVFANIILFKFLNKNIRKKIGY